MCRLGYRAAKDCYITHVIDSACCTTCVLLLVSAGICYGACDGLGPFGARSKEAPCVTPVLLRLVKNHTCITL